MVVHTSNIWSLSCIRMSSSKTRPWLLPWVTMEATGGRTTRFPRTTCARRSGRQECHGVPNEHGMCAKCTSLRKQATASLARTN